MHQQEVVAWQADNPYARDFRKGLNPNPLSYLSTTLTVSIFFYLFCIDTRKLVTKK